jgi:hypothetical protein
VGQLDLDIVGIVVVREEAGDPHELTGAHALIGSICPDEIG